MARHFPEQQDKTMYDVIPDIHGDIDRLERILTGLGYVTGRLGWEHPEVRTALFLGDLIDSGANNRAVIDTVRQMTDAGRAIVLMGNHELNAILFNTPGASYGRVQDGWMRAHTPERVRQHRSFLAEYADHSEAHRAATDWFLTMPLLHDAGYFRAIHACWDPEAVRILLDRRPDARLRAEDLQEVALEDTAFAKAVVRLVKGPEFELPVGLSYRDHYGTSRTTARLNWWTRSPFLRDLALSIPCPDEIPEDARLERDRLEPYGAFEPPVVFGHYKMTGTPACGLNTICLDYPAHDCAARSDGETVSLATFASNKLEYEKDAEPC